MSEPLQVPQQRRPAEIRIPTLTREETERRAGRAFDASLNVVVTQMSRAPPPAEMAALGRLVNAALRNSSPGQEVNLDPIISQYVQANPNSAIAKNILLTGGATDWLFTPSGQFGFNQTALNAAIRGQLANVRQATIDSLVTLNNPSNRDRTVPTSPIATELVSALQQQLSSQFRSGNNQVPATVEWRSQQQQLYFATLLPPPDQRVEF